MPNQILTDIAASISELKTNPMKVVYTWRRVANCCFEYKLARIYSVPA